MSSRRRSGPDINALANIANVYYQRKTAKALEENKAVVAEQNKIAQDQLRLQQEQVNIEKKKEWEQKIKKANMELLFKIYLESKKMMECSFSYLDKYIHLCGSVTKLKNHELTTDIADSLSEKQDVQDLIDKINGFHKSARESFTEQDEKDLDAVMDIIEGDEEAEIQKHQNNINHHNDEIVKLWAGKNIKNHVRLIEESKKIPSMNMYQIVSEHKTVISDHRGILLKVLTENHAADDMYNNVKERLKKEPNYLIKPDKYSQVKDNSRSQHNKLNNSAYKKFHEIAAKKDEKNLLIFGMVLSLIIPLYAGLSQANILLLLISTSLGMYCQKDIEKINNEPKPQNTPMRFVSNFIIGLIIYGIGSWMS